MNVSKMSFWVAMIIVLNDFLTQSKSLFNGLVFFLSGCCPKDTSLTEVPDQECPENIGQIQRLYFARKGQIKFDLTDPANNIPLLIAGAGNTPDQLAPWALLFSATDDTKVVKTPFTTGGGDSAINPGTVVSQGGGDNTYFSGATKVTAINPSDGTIRLDSLSGDVIKALRKLICEGELEVWFINQDNKIIGSKDSNELFSGFCASNVVLGSLSNQGYGTIDGNVLTFQLPYNWDETKHFVTPVNWSPLAA